MSNKDFCYIQCYKYTLKYAGDCPMLIIKS